MKNTFIKAGAAVMKTKVCDPDFNANEIIALMQEYSDCGILVFPELSVTGYTCADLFGQQILLERTEAALAKIAEASMSLPGMTVAVGAPLRYGNKLYNCAVYISEGEYIAAVPKINIPMYSEFYEGRWFASGRGIKDAWVIINDCDVPFGTDLLVRDLTSGAVVGTDICEDLWVADKPSTHACLAGANIIVNLSASDEVIGKQEYRRQLVSQQSGACYCDYIYVSAGMDESSTDLVFSGHTLIAECGKVLNDSIFPERPHVETALLDIEVCMHNRAHENTFGTDDSSWRYADTTILPVTGSPYLNSDMLLDILKEEDYFIAKNPFVPEDDEERGKRCRKILRIQANGLATRVRNTGIKNLVIGISGGLDSTLALIVAHEAKKLVPEIHIIAITMPNRGNTTSLTYNNAVSLMKLLADDIREVPIEEGVKSHLKDIGHSGSYEGEGDTTYENAQARMRTYILMDTANRENGLVVGTGDLSELALGWCTYNGDHMSMYGVNASVPKTLVQYICRAYAYTCGNDELKDVLLSIIDTPISPELTPNADGQIAQKTEEKIGKYDLNDFFMFYVLRYGFAPDKILAFARYAYDADKEYVRNAEIRFYQRFCSQQFKRSCLPDGPKVGSVTLSPRGDWRMPSDVSSGLFTNILKKD